MSRLIDDFIADQERRYLDADARELFEQDTQHACWLSWDRLDESMRAEYRRLALAERRDS